MYCHGDERFIYSDVSREVHLSQHTHSHFDDLMEGGAPSYQWPFKEMKRVKDFTPSFIRALILKTPPELRNPKRKPRKSWSEDKNKRSELVARLEEAEKQHDFYTGLYRQYSADLLKTVLYVRKIVTTDGIREYLEEHHEATLRDLCAIVLEN